MTHRVPPTGILVLECTLRDGSYTNNFGFTVKDTREICSALEKAGFKMIEIGHGVGLNASNCGYGQAAETDEAYLAAAAETITTSSFGMFCIPGIARLEDIDLAAKYKMDFIRIGTNVTEVENAAPFVERAKHHGMYVTANLMKSYVLGPKIFAQRAKLAESYGVDLLGIVDSAGGMLPEDIEHYFCATRDICQLRLGFHGHNNLGMAVSHSLRAIDLGAEVIDTSLQGLGRGGGNAPTEMVVALLQRRSFNIGIDPIDVSDVAEQFIRPLVQKRGISSIDVISGMSQFHSSYTGVIRKFASQYNIDPRMLIMAVTQFDKVNAPDALVEKVAKKLKDKPPRIPFSQFSLWNYFGDEQR
ncbi:MAG: 4-hydroxy-2-oxovalerate aldolase [Phycisphaerae bacterium]|nr:4-hydroxy-2-oxovalerate aldolase [Phycisphaerae bacterium]